MKLSVKKSSTAIHPADTMAIFLTEEECARPAAALPAAAGFLTGITDLAFFKGKSGEAIFLPLQGHPNVIMVGLGKREKITADTLRNAGAKVTTLCRERGIEEVQVLVPAVKGTGKGTGMEGSLAPIAEGLALSNYTFNKYKAKDEDAPAKNFDRAVFLADEKEAPQRLREVAVISENTTLCRNLINEISSVASPVTLAAEARALEKIPGVTCTVLGKKELEKLKMGLFLAVNQGSAIPPQLVVLQYAGNPSSKKYFALVGKGITFDSGGMNLKPSGHMETMRMDMAGAATVLCAFKTAADLKLKKNIYAVMPLTENMLSNDAYRPGDIYRAYNGKTVEIGNTDAEGRLILADALAYTHDKLRPDCIVDVATLTGACVATFGEIVAAYLTNDDALGRVLKDASAATGERLWELPLYPEYEENIKSDVADLNNISAEKNAGTIIGGIFLKNFIGTTRWAHIDIAGTAWYSKSRGFVPKNATGFGVRLLLEAIRRWEG